MWSCLHKKCLKVNFQQLLSSTLSDSMAKQRWYININFMIYPSQGFSQYFRIGCPKIHIWGDWIGCPTPFHPIALHTKSMDIRASKFSNRVSEKTSGHPSSWRPDPSVIWRYCKRPTSVYQVPSPHDINLVQWNLVITRSLGPWKLPCYIRFLIISGKKPQRNIKSWD